MPINQGPQKIQELLGKKPDKKPPAYQWQELALKVIEQLNIPPNKKNAVFLVCKKYSRNYIEKCLNDTKELAKAGEKWRYFFKLVNKK